MTSRCRLCCESLSLINVHAHSFTHSVTHSHVGYPCSLNHLFPHSTGSPTHFHGNLLTHSLIYSFVYKFAHPLSLLFTHSFVSLFTLSLTHLCSRSCIHLHVYSHSPTLSSTHTHSFSHSLTHIQSTPRSHHLHTFTLSRAHSR